MHERNWGVASVGSDGQEADGFPQRRIRNGGQWIRDRGRAQLATDVLASRHYGINGFYVYSLGLLLRTAEWSLRLRRQLLSSLEETCAQRGPVLFRPCRRADASDSYLGYLPNLTLRSTDTGT